MNEYHVSYKWILPIKLDWYILYSYIYDEFVRPANLNHTILHMTKRIRKKSWLQFWIQTRRWRRMLDWANLRKKCSIRLTQWLSFRHSSSPCKRVRGDTRLDFFYMESNPCHSISFLGLPIQSVYWIGIWYGDIRVCGARGEISK